MFWQHCFGLPETMNKGLWQAMKRCVPRKNNIITDSFAFCVNFYLIYFICNFPLMFKIGSYIFV